MNMPHRYLRRIAPKYAPADDLARAIADLDKRLEQIRLVDEPIPFDAYRARRILREATPVASNEWGPGPRYFPTYQLHGSL